MNENTHRVAHRHIAPPLCIITGFMYVRKTKKEILLYGYMGTKLGNQLQLYYSSPASNPCMTLTLTTLTLTPNPHRTAS